jgi:fructokinase
MTAGERFGGIELGGTKSTAVLAEGNRIIDSSTFPTADPAATLTRLRDDLARWHAERPLAAVGIASFGPLQLRRDDPAFGRMLDTPKPGWRGASVAAELTRAFECPWQVDTDVNAAALAEYRWGAARGCRSACYITIGTGVGGGLIVGGETVQGAMHPEIGHLRLRRANGDEFAGICPFHGDCIEGLVSGPALAARFGMAAEAIPDDHPLWRDVASDLAELAAAILLTTSAERILFGGSVSISRAFLLPLVRELAVARVGSYLSFLDSNSAIEIIRLAGLGAAAGPLGAIALAQAAFVCPDNRLSRRQVKR